MRINEEVAFDVSRCKEFAFTIHASLLSRVTLTCKPVQSKGTQWKLNRMSNAMRHLCRPSVSFWRLRADIIETAGYINARDYKFSVLGY